MNILGKFTALAALALATTALGSCDSMFHDDLADCPQGVYVRFYQQTPCNTLNSVVGKVNNLHVLAFDKKTGLLANYVAANGEANLTADYQTLIPLHQGQYELVAWTGNADELASAKLQKGVTKKSDVFFQLRQQQDGSLVFPNTPEPLRYGFAGTGLNRLPADADEKKTFGDMVADDVISIPDPAVEGSVFKHAAINLRQQALRVNVNVIVDPSVKPSKYPTGPAKFNLQLLTNGRELAHEALQDAKNQALWQVPQSKLIASKQESPLMAFHQEVVGDTLKSQFNILGNTLDQLAQARLTLTHEGKNVELSPAVMEYAKGLDLPQLIKVALGQGNLNCKGEVTINLYVNNKCPECGTYMVFDVVIANWSVHSYETILHS